MKSTLSFVGRLFARGMDLEKRGLPAEACRTYQRLLHISPLTRKMVGKTAGRLGRLQLERGQYARARRNLTLAVARLPQNAEYQNLLAKASAADESCDIDQAGQPYLSAVKLQPDNPLYLIDLACHLGQRCQTEEAVDLFWRAFKIGGNDLEVVGSVARGLRDMGKADEAQRVLRQAQFRHARDPRFRQLWNDHQFQLLWASQKASHAGPADDIGILRFVPKMRQATGSAG